MINCDVDINAFWIQYLKLKYFRWSWNDTRMSVLIRTICYNKSLISRPTLQIIHQCLHQVHIPRSQFSTCVTLRSSEPEKKDRILTIPNLLCVSRWKNLCLRYNIMNETKLYLELLLLHILLRILSLVTSPWHVDCLCMLAPLTS